MGRNADRDQSFTELVRLVGDPLFRTSLLLSGDWQQAEDLVQTSLAKLYARAAGGTSTTRWPICARWWCTSSSAVAGAVPPAR